jgi:CubicO group peptidase (beta-lactamase class C family)
MQEGEVPGLSVAIVAGGRIRQAEAFGVANTATGEPVTKRTIFEAASLSKPVVAYAVLKLIDTGKLRLDAPIAGYVGGGELSNDPRWKRITVRMLLSHRSGLPNEIMPGQTAKIYFEPGTRFSYSGLGYTLLQSAIERSAGEPFESAMRRLVFEPLAMADSSFTWRAVYSVQKAHGHDSSARATDRRKPDFPKAPSSLHTHALDYAKFLQALVNRTGLSPASWKAMTHDQGPVQSNCVVCFAKPDALSHKALAWGLGWAIEHAAGKKYIFHWGENNGDFQAFAIAHPASRSAVVILSNSGNGLAIVPAKVARLFPGEHPAFAWMGYDRYDSPARLIQRQILSSGAKIVLSQIDAAGSSKLTESQWNRIGYQLLGRGRTDDAVHVFRLNAKLFPNSTNVHDSLGEAELKAGNKAGALKHYQRALELDPSNTNARDVLAKLEAGAAK